MPSLSDKIRITYSVTNSICYDQRVLKMAETVSSRNTEITIVGRKSGNSCSYENVPFITKPFGMIFKRGFLFYMFFNIRLFIFLLIYKSDLLVANDLDTLLPNFLVSKLKRIPLIYDSHEYFTGVPEIRNRPFVKWIWKTIERFIFPYLDYIMTVSDSIADRYEAEYGKKPLTVRNCARRSEKIQPYPRAELGIPREMLIVILQGTGINVDRGGEELIDAIHMSDNVFLIIAGSGNNLQTLKDKANALHSNGRIRFLPVMPWNELMRYTKSADAGVCLDKDLNINYRFSLPNKLFDYISAGIPIIASNLPETSNIIREHKCGLIIDNVTPQTISGALATLKNDISLLETLKKNSVEASMYLSWESESRKVKELYEKVLKIPF